MKGMECNLSRTRKLDKLQELVLQIMEVEKGMKVIGLIIIVGVWLITFPKYFHD